MLITQHSISAVILFFFGRLGSFIKVLCFFLGQTISGLNEYDYMYDYYI